MAVPKKKVSRVRSSTRYSTYVKNMHKRIIAEQNLVPCTHCGATKRNHHVCPACGYYGDRKVMNVEKQKKVTTIAAE